MLTLRNLKEELENLTDEQLNQPAQLLLAKDSSETFDPTPDYVLLHDVLGFEKIENLNMDAPTVSSYDNKHHPNNYVILCSWNWFNPMVKRSPDEESGEKDNPGT